MATCRVCGQAIEPFMTFGRMPIANAFLLPEDFEREYFFELAPAFCESCGAFQIVEQPDSRRMFHENYAFFTRTSRYMVAHFRRFADWTREAYLDGSDPFVVEIGSNDGAMLECFAQTGIRHLGIEPSANVAEEARRHGVDTLVSFFGHETAEAVLAEHGPADAILAANVMCHIPDLHDVAEGVARLLKPRGILAFEDPYLGDMIEKTSYDQIYDEHVFIFSARAVRSLFEPHGLELIDVLPQPTHGGSMRYVFAHKGARPVAPAVGAQLDKERALGLDRPETYVAFRAACERSRGRLLALLAGERASGRRVAGYGATSKSTTVLNYCGIGPDLIEFISDTTPIKQGKYTPGSHIPVRPYDAFLARYPDSAVLFAWNHRDEIMAKEDGFRAAGGRWITYVPQVEQG
ncbi:MAG: methyltransferase domain-containing protein [Kiloniellales bacterium]